MSFGKFVLLSITSVALLLIGASQAAAFNSFELSSVTQTVNAGDQFNVSLYMDFDGLTPTTGGGLEISYDREALSFLSFVFDAGFTGNFGLHSSESATNPVMIGFGFFDMNPPFGWSGEQMIGTMTFEGLATATGTTSMIESGPSLYLPGPFYGPVDPYTPLNIDSYGSTEVTVAAAVWVVPEPSTALLLLVGLAGLSYRPVRKD